MKSVLSTLIILSIIFMTGCASYPFKVDTVRYSSWQNGEMIVREKAILINTETGETWGLSFDKRKPTRDGYVWEKLPKKTPIEPE